MGLERNFKLESEQVDRLSVGVALLSENDRYNCQG